jgi:hypothetical protein
MRCDGQAKSYQISLLLSTLVETTEGVFEASSKLLQRVGGRFPGGHGRGGVDNVSERRRRRV